MTESKEVNLTRVQKVLRLLRIFGGSILLLVGLVAIPYPGPGWLIVFTALAILAQDFVWAQRLLDYAKSRYDQWQDWLKVQPPYIKVVFWMLTAIVVVATIYLLNGYGLLNSWLRLEWDWVNSPLPIFN